jgi:hypothetical protein
MDCKEKAFLAMWTLSALRVTPIANEPLESCIWNLVWRPEESE